jgi:5-(hydroxymethyl)furfural/furfural oxidase
MTERYDVLVVGGGSAGCVLANRLTADGKLRVALVEAGPDTPIDNPDPVLWSSYPIVAYFDPRHHWTQLRVRYQPPPESGADVRPWRRYEQAKVLGGGSSINGMMANRGQTSDYDDWAAQGATGWDWAGVLPYFKRLERDLDFGGPMHGNAGPLPIRRVPKSEWPAFSLAAGEALTGGGFAEIADQSAGFDEGWFPISINNIDDHRVSTATAYLDQRTRNRPNLTILTGTRVRRLLIEEQRATGVEIVRPDGSLGMIAAGEVVVATGAIHSPAMLLKAGIGPGSHLQALGIPVVADRPGVGRNLQEHPQIAVSSYLRPGARLRKGQGRHIFAGFRYSSGVADCGAVDMYAVVVNRGGWHPLAKKLGGFLIWVNKAYSQGAVTLGSADPDKEPLVDLNLLQDPRDTRRLMDGLKLLAKLYEHPSMRNVALRPFASSYTEAGRDMAIVSKENWLRTAPVSWLLDGPERLRERILTTRVTGGNELPELVRDDQRLEAFVRDRVNGTWHCCGTCKIGQPEDPLAVVDPAGRVIGVQGLRVADASIMPSVPCANTNIPAIMVGEKISDAILDDLG